MIADPLRIEAALARLYADAGAERPEAPGVVSVRRLLRNLPAQVEVHEVPGFTAAQAADYLFRQCSVEADVDRTDDRRLAGLVYATQSQDSFAAFVLARAEDPVTRRRFTVGHEVGHIYLHFLPTGADAFVEAFDHGETRTAPDPDDPTTERPGTPDGEGPDVTPHAQADAFGDGPDDLPDLATMEAEADAFSAALLMPEPAVRAHVEALASKFGSKRSVLARRMAPDFLVSKAAMKARLDTLQIGDDN